MHDLETLRAFVRDYRLDLHQPALAQRLLAINPDSQRPAEARALYSLQQELRPFLEFHERCYPFVVAPPRTVDGGTLLLAHQIANNLPITVSDEEASRHMGLLGGTGVGKTTFLMLLILQLLRQGKRVVVLDPKDDTTSLAVRDERFLLLTPNARFNPLTQPSFLTREQFIGLIADTLCRTFYAAERTKALMAEALTEVFADHAQPSFADVHRAIKQRHNLKRTFKDRDVLQGLDNHLSALARTYPVPYRIRASISWEELFQHSLHLPTLMLDNEITFLYSLLVTLLYLYKRTSGQRDVLTHVLVNDEGNKYWSAAQSNIEQAPTTIHLQGLIREFGIALILTSVDFTSLHGTLKSNTYTSICFNVNGDDEMNALSRHLGLNEHAQQYFAKDLKKGQCLIRFGDRWRHPILATFPKLRIDKHVTAGELTAAEQRLHRWSPDLPPTIQTQPEPEEKPPQDTPTKPASHIEPPRKDTPAPPQPRVIAPTTENPQGEESPARPPIKLTVNEERLLRTTTEKLWVATKAYDAAQLSRQTGQNAKDKLVTLGLLTTGSILVRPGRGGNAVVLETTPAGYELIGRERAVGTKGGDGAQHRWCIQELEKVIPGSRVEVMVGGKSIDLLVSFDPGKHGRFLFHMDNKELPPGALLAIEVEASAPSRTAVNNITKNHAVGIFHTIVAVLPRHVATTTASLSKSVPRDLRGNYTVIDLFALLTERKQ